MPEFLRRGFDMFIIDCEDTATVYDFTNWWLLMLLIFLKYPSSHALILNGWEVVVAVRFLDFTNALVNIQVDNA